MTDKVDFARSFRGAALAGACCLGMLVLLTANCLPAPSDSSGAGGSGGDSNSSNGGSSSSNGGSSSNNGGSSSNGGTSSNNNGGTSAKGGTTSSGGTSASGGTTSSGGTSATGGTTAVVSTGGVTPAGGSSSAGPTGNTVTFSTGKAVGAMVGYGWVALGSADSISDPTCNGAAFTSATNCASTTWSTANTKGLCMTGSVPALGATPDYVGNWGVQVGVNSTDPAGSGLGQSFTSIAITVTGSPSSGLRAMVHRKTDPVGSGYCYPMTSGTAIPFTSFNTKCYDTPADGTALTAADVPNIDQVGVQVSSGTAAISVASLCMTEIDFK